MADGCACSRGAGLHPLGAADQDALRDEGERSAAGDILATAKYRERITLLRLD